MYIKLFKNGNIKKYPYSIAELKADNNQTSFPSELSDELLAEFGVYKVEQVDAPMVALNQNAKESEPILKDGKWIQTWEVVEVSADEHLARVLNARADEYPPMSDYIDGVVKGDQAQIDKYIADCKAVKLKYPKP